MDPQTAAILAALSGQASPSPGALSPFGAQPQAQQAYTPPTPSADALAASAGQGQAGSLGAQSMYGAMMTPPPAPNYWAQ